MGRWFWSIARWDDKGNWHGLYMMAFKDSFSKWEPARRLWLGKTRRPLEDDNFHRLGLGFTAGVTARDSWNYIIPILCCCLYSVDRLWARYAFRPTLHSGLVLTAGIWLLWSFPGFDGEGRGSY